MTRKTISREEQSDVGLGAGFDRDNIRVWIERADGRFPGAIVYASLHASTVRYRPGATRATVVDTVLNQWLRPRGEPDPVDEFPCRIEDQLQRGSRRVRPAA
ncbi:hypothetical protein [Actinoplanes sp. NPDC051859]|uniref:hypothetical protein n=1 Tax=Actinoplanes sp. NPDC051859 TaxID=3363909 RepID=UPI0037A36993